MKSIKEYIIESLLDDEEDLVDNNDVLIRTFIEDNYKINGSYTIKNGIVDIRGKVGVKNKEIKSLTNGLFSFGVVSGYFNCSSCDSLKDLKGAPKEIGGDFYCGYCDSLKDLKGSPKRVVGAFYCDHCKSLISLEGAPKEVGLSFYCSGCDLLKNLKGAPKEIGGDFYCVECKSLKDLKDAPKNVKIIK